MEKRIGFIGVVLEDLGSAPQVNRLIGDYQELVMGRIGVPDHDRDMGVIGLVIKGEDAQVAALAAKLGNIKGVKVKSAMTQKKIIESEIKE